MHMGIRYLAIPSNKLAKFQLKTYIFSLSIDISSAQKSKNYYHQTRFRASKYTRKCVCGRGSAPNPARASYSAPTDLPAGFWGRFMAERGTGREGRGREVKGKGYRPNGGPGSATVWLYCNARCSSWSY